MAEYINRASLINNLITFAPEHYTALINDLILKEPADDVVERKKGKWEYKPSLYPYGVEHFECSLCGESVVDRTNFCPNCGADMRGET